MHKIYLPIILFAIVASNVLAQTPTYCPTQTAATTCDDCLMTSTGGSSNWVWCSDPAMCYKNTDTQCASYCTGTTYKGNADDDSLCSNDSLTTTDGIIIGVLVAVGIIIAICSAIFYYCRYYQSPEQLRAKHAARDAAVAAQQQQQQQQQLYVPQQPYYAGQQLPQPYYAGQPLPAGQQQVYYPVQGGSVQLSPYPVQYAGAPVGPTSNYPVQYQPVAVTPTYDASGQLIQQEPEVIHAVAYEKQ